MRIVIDQAVCIRATGEHDSGQQITEVRECIGAIIPRQSHVEVKWSNNCVESSKVNAPSGLGVVYGVF